MIVDDEVLVRTSLKYLINVEIGSLSQFADFCLCGEASSGKEALEKASLLKPDIVISDMKMSEMDGLQLCKKLKQNFPNIKFIALSNYDDFEYVRGTLQNGAVDYLLKHKLSKETLLDALIRSASQRKPSEPQNSLSSNNETALRREFLIHLFTGFYSDTQEILAHINALGLSIGLRQNIPILMCIDGYQSESLRDNDLASFSIVNIITEILADKKNGAMCNLEKEKFAIILSFERTNSQSIIQNTINAILHRIRFCMNKYLNISVSFSVGNICSNILDLPNSYSLAEKRIGQRFYNEEGSIISSDVCEASNVNMDFLSLEKEQEIIYCINKHNFEELHKCLQSIFAEIRTQKPPLAIAQMTFSNLLSIINRICKSHAISLDKIYSDDILPEKQLYDFTSLSAVQQWLVSLFDKLLQTLIDSNQVQISDYVRQAINHINKHFPEQISQAQLAAKINISSVYLSRLFNQDLGTSFTEYLIDVRLNHAKYLLNAKRISIREVSAQCGFNDYIYFLKVFKKHVGCTPTEYIKMQQHS